MPNRKKNKRPAVRLADTAATAKKRAALQLTARDAKRLAAAAAEKPVVNRASSPMSPAEARKRKHAGEQREYAYIGESCSSWQEQMAMAAMEEYKM